MPHTPLRKLKPELFGDDYETDSDGESKNSEGKVPYR